MAAFYAAVLDPATTESFDGDVLVSGAIEVYLHAAVPLDEEHAHVRSEVAVKPQLAVNDIERAQVVVQSMGGALTDRSFTWNGVVHVDVVDPDGNVLQLRAPAALQS
jgi:hypothetical protein